tara:strand:- start:352 stop:753 length:402 start_codon:yes stop_codon:yes gene_type:complete
MKMQIAAVALAALAATAPVSASAKKLTGEQQLAKVLEGRVAGKPTRCVPSSPSARLYVIDKTAVIYDTGRTIYVNYTAYPETLDDDEILVVRDPMPSLCRTTQITARDRTGGFFSGAIFLKDFIPYTLPDKEG